MLKVQRTRFDNQVDVVQDVQTTVKKEISSKARASLEQKDQSHQLER
jgi:hypothetical protein